MVPSNLVFIGSSLDSVEHRVGRKLRLRLFAAPLRRLSSGMCAAKGDSTGVSGLEEDAFGALHASLRGGAVPERVADIGGCEPRPARKVAAELGFPDLGAAADELGRPVEVAGPLFGDAPGDERPSVARRIVRCPKAVVDLGEEAARAVEVAAERERERQVGLGHRDRAAVAAPPPQLE
jgi:hypothetical protein